jgi:hypothetical protein
VAKPSRGRFDLVFALVVWKLWNERNESVFKLPHQLAGRVNEELQWWCSAGLVAQLFNKYFLRIGIRRRLGQGLSQTLGL